jgi:two-component system KDP operon response regulator KdpE
MGQDDQAMLKAGLHQFGALRIDIERHQVTLGEQEVKLSAKEFSLLVYLANQAGKIVPHQELIHITHDLETDYIEAGALLRPLVSSVRNKLRLASTQVEDQYEYIENVRSLGYRLVGPSG